MGRHKELVVFTNGCFDIIHSGHIRLLKYAKEISPRTRLIVGVNTDASVARIKGRSRPVIRLADRVRVLKAIRYVDFVIPFGGDTPEGLLRKIRPDVLVKGPEAAMAPIPGADFVESYGGIVLVPRWPVTISTSSIIERLKHGHLRNR